MSYSSKISKLQLYKPTDMTGLFEENKFANAYLTQPHQMDAVMAYAFGTANGELDVINLLTAGAMNTEYVDNSVYRWKLYTQTKRAIEVAGDNIDGGSTPGISFTRFRIPLAEKWFERTDNIRFDDGTSGRIMEDPYQDGVNWIYSIELNTEDATEFLDPTNVTYGARVRKLWSDVEEFSIRGGGVALSTPYEMENRIQTFRKTVAVTRSALTNKLVMDIPTGNGKMQKVWATALEWQAFKEMKEEQNNAFIYGRQSFHQKGENGRTIYKGAGFREQISPNNVWEYGPKLTYNIIEDFFSTLAYNCKLNGGDHKFVVLTGREGMKQADEAITEKFKSRGLVIADSSKFISGSGRDLTLTGYFKRVELLNGITVEFRQFDPYDDIYMHGGLLDLETGRPKESARMTVMNFGTTNGGGANIKKIVKRGADGLAWNVSGSVDPSAGAAKSISTSRASGIDGYEFHLLEEAGIMLGDPTSCGELIPSGIKY